MKFIIKHDTEFYARSGIKLYFMRLFGRIINQRRKLTFVILLLLIVQSTMHIQIAVVLLTGILSIIVIDFGIWMFGEFQRKKRIVDYIANGGQEFEIHADQYFSYVQDNTEFKKVQWNDIYEFCLSKNPSFFSFRDRLNKNLYIIRENELKDNSYNVLLNQIKRNIQVKVLLEW